ncbi:hypothetical protein Cadr_000011847 [Camelus dromedarius]|uniref:Uncharacterized protein n=1 Tax=Camelus dromedarius TaxID=9838 RepID=A0A5N4DTK5_CAMDR|nr:hypothetical protein Cadr_000011847 [Camelus dromedarius]KAB1274300.1 hypothetical protein Cadr_000011847 [Camelus dromedarius]
MDWGQDPAIPLSRCHHHCVTPVCACDMELSCSSAVKFLNLLPSRRLWPSPDFGPLVPCQEFGLWPQPHGKSPPAPRPGRELEKTPKGRVPSPAALRDTRRPRCQDTKMCCSREPQGLKGFLKRK